MKIILEGPNGAGKTTLAKELAKYYGLSYNHESKPSDDVDPLNYFLRVVDRLGNKVVMDRMALSNYIYGRVIGHKRYISMHDLYEFNNGLMERRVQTIICLPPPEICFATWKQRVEKQVFSREKMFYEVYSHYAYYAAHSSGYTVYDFTRQTLRDLDKKLFQG
jgi:thymidylate kinase